jgi:exonuclease SbcC
MIIQSIKLNNIRSYLSQEISFPQGSVLLSGDIGSGKSTILLGIEFALFGVRRKYLSGESLLRNGKSTGSVELHFSIESIDYVIKRTLKRSKEEVQQDSGYLLVNNVKKEGTPIELKSFILNILGYPEDLLTKTKNLVYRYTVYTPQEEMKQILFDEEENRLDTLRKVFGIDKYKLIRENVLLYIHELKERAREYQGKIYDIEEKKKQKREREEEIKAIEKTIKALKPSLTEIEDKIMKQKISIHNIEKQLLELKKLEQELALLEMELKNLLDKRKKNSENIQVLKESLEKFSKELPKDLPDIKTIAEQLKELQKQQEQSEKNIIMTRNKIRECEVKIQHADTLKERILKINQCPTCDQKVEESHKDFITSRENKTIAELRKSMFAAKEEEQKLLAVILNIKKKLEETRKEEKECAVLQIRLKNMQEKAKQQHELEFDQETLKEQIGKVNIKKRDISEQLTNYTGIDEGYKTQKELLDKLISQERKLALEQNSLEKEKEGSERLLMLLEKEIAEKAKTQEKLAQLKEYQFWLESYFIGLMTTMEKQVMMRVYHEFNELFQKWFDILLEDETISVRLDDRFTPIIQQNGYDIDISNLSGGEKTSCALAYRLALNKVINDIISTIKTKDLIILDEPTDGFSTEQLDKVRDVLEQLNMKQVIIVSHETKIESFVSKVIRVNKEEHVSSIVA